MDCNQGRDQTIITYRDPTMAAAPSPSSKRKGSAEGGKPFKKKPKVENKKPTEAPGDEKSSTAQKRAVKQERQSHRRHADAPCPAGGTGQATPPPLASCMRSGARRNVRRRAIQSSSP